MYSLLPLKKKIFTNSNCSLGDVASCSWNHIGLSECRLHKSGLLAEEKQRANPEGLCQASWALPRLPMPPKAPDIIQDISTLSPGQIIWVASWEHLSLFRVQLENVGHSSWWRGARAKRAASTGPGPPQGDVGLWDLFLQLRTTFIKDNWRSQGHNSAQLIRAILNKSLILKATRTFLVPPQFTGSWIRVWIQIQEAICCSCCLPAGIHCEALEFEQPPPLLPFHQQPLQGHKAGIHPRKATSVYKCKADEGTEKSAWMLK